MQIHVMQNTSGLVVRLEEAEAGWTLGPISLNGRMLEPEGTRGVLFLRHTETGEVRWLPGDSITKDGEHRAILAGAPLIDGVRLQYSVEIALDDTRAVVYVTPAWTVDNTLSGWEVGLAYHDGLSGDWRVQSYPWAGNSEAMELAPMTYCGVPGALIYRPDLSLVLLFAIAGHSDYLNPTTWTGKTGFFFANRSMAPQFRAGGGLLSPHVAYALPLQLFINDAGEFAPAITGIMQNWIAVNDYQVDRSLVVRTPAEAFEIALDGRRKMQNYRPGIGYEHHRGTPFVYLGNNPYIAYYEYRLYELTGDTLWRDRACEQLDFVLKGQQDTGVLHTSWYFEPQPRPDGATAEGFCSWDWFHNGYKVDINVWMARYMLQTWERVKQREGVDRQDWFQAAMKALDWVFAQQNEDGGLPQEVDVATGRRSCSTVCGRALVAMPIIARLVGDGRFARLAADLERFLRSNVEERFWYTGMHPDLPPGDFEQDSIYAVVEYWLHKYDETLARECLDHAVANAYYGLLHWCPKQLSWVRSPTQCAHSEQQHFNQYSVYCYGNRKIQCLDRLFQLTGNPLFAALRDRVMQLNFFVQVTDGPYRGAMTEAIADPWLEREHGFEWRGSPYTSELVTDLMLQLLDMGLVSAASVASDRAPGRP